MAEPKRPDTPRSASTSLQGRLSTQLPTHRTPLPPLTPTVRPGTRPTEAVSAQAVGALPNLVIIGAMKCGTTSLHEYLGYHPSISMSRRKEMNFFVHHQNWSKGLGWYRAHFPEAKQVVGEASPNYTRYPVFAGVPERMHMVVPNAKLIFCVRDPIERMVSHYLHAYSLGRENRTVEAAFRQRDNNPYLLCSRYMYQLEQYLPFYDPAQIKLVVLEELYKNPLETLRDIFYFLGVDPSYEDSRFERATAKKPTASSRRRSPLKSWMVRNNVQGFYWTERHLPWLFGKPIPIPKLSADLREGLAEQLGADVAALRRFSGLDLTAWGF